VFEGIKKMNDDGFAKRLRELRRQSDISQADLAQIVGVHYMHLSRYERGISKPKSETLRRLAEALGVTADYLLEGKSGDMAKAKLEDRELLLMFKEIETLTEEDKSFIKKVLDALLTKKRIQALAAG
jgi:transcriptional regulator with XRE-family HTH domain